MTRLKFFQFPCLSDNYGLLVHDPQSGDTASIDAPDHNDVMAALEENGWNLTIILVTHHHYDHTQGIEPLKKKFNCPVVGPAAEAAKIPTLDKKLQDGDEFNFGSERVRVIATPGHTLGMINYHFLESGVVCTGDTLFSLGCGRVFEGTPEMMWNSLSRLAQLPPETEVYCGHEYTLSNARFAITVDPDNAKLRARLAEVEQLRADGKPTLPTTIGAELETNPFLRAADAGIRNAIGKEAASDVEVFAEIRARKDQA